MSFENEKIVENKTCQQCQVSFDITDKDLEFYEKISPVFSGKKYSISTPKLCPKCRQQRRLSFRNERKLYKRKCDATGNEIISMYSPDKNYKVYNSDYWWSDAWDSMDYAVDFNFEKSFFEQITSLKKEIPLMSLVSFENENSPFINFVGFSKNVHLSSDILEGEDISYCYTLKKCTNIIDSYDLEQSSHCYECFLSEGLSNCFYVQESRYCSNSWYLNDCENCSMCLFSYGLKNKQYYVFNKDVGKEKFLEILGNINSDVGYIQKYKKLLHDSIKRKDQNYSCTNVSGNYLTNSKNSIICYEGTEVQDCKFCLNIHSMNDCMDISIHNPDCSLDYEAISGGKLTKCISNISCRELSLCYYNIYCFNSSDLFGCIGLKNKQYCILNKQYTKEEYNILVPKIIEHMKTTGEWGEFFPSKMSPFGYNETVAQEHFPLERDDIFNPPDLPKIREGQSQIFSPGFEGEMSEGQRGLLSGGRFNWSDYEAPLPKVDKIISANKLPDNIADIPDDILNWAVECEVTKKPFRIIEQELTFYRKHNLPIPRKHPDQRHLERMQLRNPRKLYKRDCDKCDIEMDTTYAPEREERVYCEECYRKEVY